jgi:PPOX class probable F420-dependent enzyme
MFNLDTTTAFGARVADRLHKNIVIWLTTVGADGTPQPIPVWFLWNGREFLVYSEPNKAKLRNIAHRPNVALNLDGDGRGGDIVVVTGAARIVPDEPPASANRDYMTKYHDAILRIGLTDDGFAAAYSVAIRVTPQKLRGH